MVFYFVLYFDDGTKQILSHQQIIQEEQNNRWVQEWQMIPQQAFLLFPAGDEIRSGEKEKAWRKIFQNGDPYDSFQENSIEQLDKKLQAKKVKAHLWFSRANKLRFLQANKFKYEDTIKSVEKASKWRSEDFPVKMSPQLSAKLNSGCFYFCGRDHRFRPILVADIAKFQKGDENIVPRLLMVILEFMLDQLLIEGQVENYVMVLDLQSVNMDMKDTVMKIVDFTSNTYRSRLFASYLLGMPTFLSFLWNGLASSLVSENTLRKIKISKKMHHEEMWEHIDKSVIQKKYGGEKADMTSYNWPPPKQILADNPRQRVPPSLSLITPAEYNKRYQAGSLSNRKVNINLVILPAPVPPRTSYQVEEEMVKVVDSLQSRNQPVDGENKALQNQVNGISQINILTTQEFNRPPKTPQNLKSTNPNSSVKKNQYMTQDMVKMEYIPPIRERTFQLFFQDDQFLIAAGIMQLGESRRKEGDFKNV